MHFRAILATNEIFLLSPIIAFRACSGQINENQNLIYSTERIRVTPIIQLFKQDRERRVENEKCIPHKKRTRMNDGAYRHQGTRKNNQSSRQRVSHTVLINWESETLTVSQTESDTLIQSDRLTEKKTHSAGSLLITNTQTHTRTESFTIVWSLATIDPLLATHLSRLANPFYPGEQ